MNGIIQQSFKTTVGNPLTAVMHWSDGLLVLMACHSTNGCLDSEISEVSKSQSQITKNLLHWDQQCMESFNRVQESLLATIDSKWHHGPRIHRLSLEIVWKMSGHHALFLLLTFFAQSGTLKCLLHGNPLLWFKLACVWCGEDDWLHVVVTFCSENC